jgi:diacylglycerol kinase family enzyme
MLYPPDGDMQAKRDVLILANRQAGTGSGSNHVGELVAALEKYRLKPHVSWHRGQWNNLLHAYGSQLRCVVAVGGDGTVGDVINLAAGVPVAVLPLGNENLVARHFHCPRSGRRLARTIVAATWRQLDLARAGQRRFCLMASAGFDAEVTHLLHRFRSGHVNKLTYALRIVQAAATYRFPEIQVEIADSGERLRGALVLAFNLPEYAFRLPLAPRARADDGVLNLCVLQRVGVINLARYVSEILRGRHEQRPDVYVREARSVRLWSDGPVPLQLDGDPVGQLPVQIDVVPAALRLLCDCA